MNKYKVAFLLGCLSWQEALYASSNYHEDKEDTNNNKCLDIFLTPKKRACNTSLPLPIKSSTQENISTDVESSDDISSSDTFESLFSTPIRKQIGTKRNYFSPIERELKRQGLDPKNVFGCQLSMCVTPGNIEKTRQIEIQLGVKKGSIRTFRESIPHKKIVSFPGDFNKCILTPVARPCFTRRSGLKDLEDSLGSHAIVSYNVSFSRPDIDLEKAADLKEIERMQRAALTSQRSQAILSQSTGNPLQEEEKMWSPYISYFNERKNDIDLLGNKKITSMEIHNFF